MACLGKRLTPDQRRRHIDISRVLNSLKHKGFVERAQRRRWDVRWRAIDALPAPEPPFP
jgi:hypothetical protein